MEKFFTKKKNAVLISIFAMILWGSAIPLIKFTYQYLNIGPADTGSKILVAGIRFFMAGILSFIYYFIIEKKSKVKESSRRLNFKAIIILALLQTFLQYFFYYIGLSTERNIIIYKTDDGKANVVLMAKDGNIWMNQNQLAELFDTSKQTISYHITNILEERELDSN